ncbi:MAG: hypothetical protein R2772_07315 [Chitinophagales bacterium]
MKKSEKKLSAANVKALEKITSKEKLSKADLTKVVGGRAFIASKMTKN